MAPAEVVAVLGPPYYQCHYATGATWVWNSTTRERARSLAVVFAGNEPKQAKDVAQTEAMVWQKEASVVEVAVYNEFLDPAAAVSLHAHLSE